MAILQKSSNYYTRLYRRRLMRTNAAYADSRRARRSDLTAAPTASTLRRQPAPDSALA